MFSSPISPSPRDSRSGWVRASRGRRVSGAAWLVAACSALIAPAVGAQCNPEFHERGGIEDAFGAPFDGTTRSTTLDGWGAAGSTTWADFDEALSASVLGHTFEDLPFDITCATLTLRVRRTGAPVLSVRVGLSEAGGAYAWDYTTPITMQGMTETITIELSAVSSAVLARMNAEHRLDLAILGAGMQVDYAEVSTAVGSQVPRLGGFQLLATGGAGLVRNAAGGLDITLTNGNGEILINTGGSASGIDSVFPRLAQAGPSSGTMTTGLQQLAPDGDCGPVLNTEVKAATPTKKTISVGPCKSDFFKNDACIEIQLYDGSGLRRQLKYLRDGGSNLDLLEISSSSVQISGWSMLQGGRCFRATFLPTTVKILRTNQTYGNITKIILCDCLNENPPDPEVKGGGGIKFGNVASTTMLTLADLAVAKDSVPVKAIGSATLRGERSLLLVGGLGLSSGDAVCLSLRNVLTGGGVQQPKESAGVTLDPALAAAAPSGSSTTAELQGTVAGVPHSPLLRATITKNQPSVYGYAVSSPVGVTSYTISLWHAGSVVSSGIVPAIPPIFASTPASGFAAEGRTMVSMSVSHAPGTAFLIGGQNLVGDRIEITADSWQSVVTDVEDMLLWTSAVPRMSIPRMQTATSYGAGCAGTSGNVPRISVSRLLRLGSPADVELANGLPNSPAAAALSLGRTLLPLGSCQLHIDFGPQLLLTAPTQTGSTGAAKFSLRVPSLTALVGLKAYFQWVVFDPNGGFLNGLSLSPGLEARIGE